MGRIGLGPISVRINSLYTPLLVAMTGRTSGQMWVSLSVNKPLLFLAMHWTIRLGHRKAKTVHYITQGSKTSSKKPELFLYQFFFKKRL